MKEARVLDSIGTTQMKQEILKNVVALAERVQYKMIEEKLRLNLLLQKKI